MSTVRVRFAPSPTGPLHIGGVRTALYNYLFAKKHQGTFVLRIEDTDQNRFVTGAEQYIIDALNWCNIPYDEGPGKAGNYGPYRQSERKDLYAAYAKQLVDSGQAYYAFDTTEALDARRQELEAQGETFIYNWHNRDHLNNSLSLSEAALEDRLKSGAPYVIRFKSPAKEELQLHDEIRGSITIDTSTLDDKVLFKADGMPTYHLANIVDDHLMEITHVIRGEEWLPSLALHVLLYRALGWKAPSFAHLPLILKPTGKGKLSKRDGEKMGFPVFPLAWTDPKTSETSMGYREENYLPQAVVNMLAFLGWNPGTEQELFSLEALIDAFDLGQVHKAGAKFDPEKTKWFQQQHLQEVSDDYLATQFQKQLADHQLQPDRDTIDVVVKLVRERAVFAKDLWELSDYFFVTPTAYDPSAVKKAWKDKTPAIMTALADKLYTLNTWTAEVLQQEIKAWIGESELGFGAVMMPLRLCLVGALRGPDVFDIAAVIGKEESLLRIEKALEYL
ncbi:glutamate--tRNA ligase [Croceiramulus getboli]|nr:glutamate--tRNA ligase [Flavobacteriaceae bacterium YJPT1-3]